MDLSKLQSTLLKRLSDALGSSTLKKVASDIASTIRDRTRQGLGVGNTGGSKSPLKPLSPGYIASRRSNKGLSPKTSPSESNLTLTGDMLDSLKSEIKGTKIIVEVKGQENAEKARYVSKDRPFMHLSKDEIKEISDSVRKALLNSFK